MWSDCCSQAIFVHTATGVPWSEFRAIHCPVHMYVAWTRGQRMTSKCHHAVQTLRRMKVPPMNHAQVDVDRRRFETHREEDQRKVTLFVSGKECTCQV